MPRFAAVALFALGCGSPGGAPAGAEVDAATDSLEQSPADAALQTWDTVEELSNDGEVIVERVSYFVGGLRIYARMCRPVDTGAHDLIVYNHGGWLGLDLDTEVTRCRDVARFGWVWLGSSYRGEDGSDGNIELCLGEVDDVLRMLEIAGAQPYVDPQHVMMYGVSHGGCITLRALERGAPVRAAADLFGPTDLGALDVYWHQQIDAGAPMSGFYSQLAGVLETAAGGTPGAVPAAYAARSPIQFVGDLPATVPLLVVQGADDAIVPPVQSCNFAVGAAMPSYHVGSNEQPTTAIPPSCSAGGPTWTATARPTPTWPGSRYFVVYDGLAHETTSTAAMTMLEDVATFTMAKL